MGAICGIDIGTSTSMVAAMRRGAATILSLDDRDRVMPTVISLDRGEISIGAPARGLLETNPDYTFPALKRLLGRRFDDPHVQQWATYAAYEIVPGPSGEAWVRGPDKLYSPEELLAEVLKKLRAVATSVLHDDVTGCVIGAPAHFDVVQREALKTAVRLAGMEPVRMLSEPTAAAVAVGVDRTSNRKIAVVDFGGGTLDITILRIAGTKFQEVAKTGDQFLGGEDFDQRIVEWLVGRFKEKNGVDLRDDPSARNRLRIGAEKAKETLSAQLSAPINARNIHQARTHFLHLDEVLEREEMEQLVADLVDRMREPCREALKKAGLAARDIDEVVLVGGMTRMPIIQQTIAEIFGRTPSMRNDPVTVVALGCAMQAAALSGDMKKYDLAETNSMPFQVQVGNGGLRPMIRANVRLPARERRVFALADPAGDAASIRIFHGTRMVDRLVLNGLQPSKGPPLIELELDVDEDGVLTTRATNKATKATIEHRIHAEYGMTEAQRAELRDIEEEAA